MIDTTSPLERAMSSCGMLATLTGKLLAEAQPQAVKRVARSPRSVRSVRNRVKIRLKSGGRSGEVRGQQLSCKKKD